MENPTFVCLGGRYINMTKINYIDDYVIRMGNGDSVECEHVKEDIMKLLERSGYEHR